MYSIFNSPITVDRGTLALTQVDYFANCLKDDINAYTQFYRPASHAVPSDHFLVKLLHSINVSIDHGIYGYVGRVQDLALDLSMMLKMTSMQAPGASFTNVLYGDGIAEILIATIDDFDIMQAESRWMDLTPITVLSHPVASIDFPELWGQTQFDNPGIAVIAINIPMLALQYRQFRLAEMALGIENRHNVMQFLTAYPLCNAIRSHINVGYFNMFNEYYFNGTLSNQLFDRRYARIDRSELAYKTITTVFNKVIGKQGTVYQLMENIQLPFDSSLYGALQLPDILFTRQCIWALILARIPYIKFLVNINSDFGLANFTTIQNRIKLDLQRYRNDRGLVGTVSNYLREYMDIEIETGIKPYL